MTEHRYARGEWLFYDVNGPTVGEDPGPWSPYVSRPAPVEVLLDDGDKGVWITSEHESVKARLVEREHLRPRIELGTYKRRDAVGAFARFRVTNVVRMTAGFYVLFELISNPRSTFHLHIDTFARDYERVED